MGPTDFYSSYGALMRVASALCSGLFIKDVHISILVFRQSFSLDTIQFENDVLEYSYDI